MKKRLLSLLVCIAILTTTVLVGAAGNPVKAATLTVGPEGYSTIQAAIDAAADDDTIVVAAGTYSGTANGEVFPITVDKRVTLLGAQANVDPRPSQGGRTGGESIIDGEETSDTVLQILASGVEVNGFTITGGTYDIVRESGFDSENMLQGLLFRYNIIYDSVAPGDEGIQIAYSDSVVIEYNYAHDIFQDAFNICYSSNGVIRYNEAHDSQSENAAIYCYGTIDTDIIGNLVYNVDHGDDQHGNGIQLGDAGDGGSGGVIRDNVIHDVAQDGICVDDMTGVTIENNTVYGADSWDGAVYLRTVHNSTFTNNRIYNNDAIGVLIQDSSTITLSGNSICSNADTNDTKYPGTAGIWITADSDASTIAIHSNNIHANTEYGATNLDTLHTLSATGNWWGESSGPYHPSANPTGSGNPVSDNVDFSSWETGPFAMTWYVSPGESIQEVVDAAHVGDTVVVAAGTYVGKVTVNKTLTLNGANMGISAGATPGTRGPESVIQGGVQIQADDVVFDGFTIDGPATTGQIDGIYIVGGTSGLTIANNVLAGDGRAQASDGWAMEFGYYTSAITVRNNYVGNWWSTYINPTNSGSNLLFEGNHFDNNHVGIGSDGLNDVTIQYNKFTGNNLEAFGTSNVGSNIQVYDNDFVSNAAGINHYGGGQAVDAADNWWGDNTGPYHATSNPGGLGDEVNGNVSFIPWTGMTAPAVTSVLPNQGEQGQTLTGVVIAGTNFVGIESGGISFGAGITVNSFTVNSATQITASITIAADATPAARDVTVTNYIGTGTLTGGFTVTFSGTIGTPSLVSPDNGAEVSGTSVSFEWSAVPGAVNYKLLVSTSTSIFDTSKYKCNMLVGNVTTYLDTGYPGTGTKYYWWVWAYDAGGNSSPWAQVSANRRDFTSVPSLGAPALISPANAAEVPGTSVSFEWSSVTGAVDYKLLVSTSTNIFDTSKYKCNVNTGNVTTYIDTGYLGAGTKYYWWVWAYAADGTSSLWSQVSANRREFTNVPSIGTPALISPANAAEVPGASVSFEWSSVTGAVDYKLLVSTSTNVLDASKYKCNVNTGSLTTYLDTGYPANGTKYYWWVWAYDAGGGSSLWSQVSANRREFTSTPSLGAPALISPANGALIIGTSVSFEWSSVTGAVDYKLLVSTSTNILDTSKYKCNVNTGNVTTYLDTGYHTNGTVYYWWVWAYDAGGGSSLWSQVSANRRTFTNVPIAAPVLVSPANGASVSGSSVTFDWDPVDGAVDYKLLVSTSTNILDTASYKLNLNTGSGDITSYIDTGYPADGTVYYWWVWAYDAYGNASLWSQVSANMRSFTSVA